jgi:hypothetical protein
MQPHSDVLVVCGLNLLLQKAVAFRIIDIQVCDFPLIVQRHNDWSTSGSHASPLRHNLMFLNLHNSTSATPSTAR